MILVSFIVVVVTILDHQVGVEICLHPHLSDTPASGQARHIWEESVISVIKEHPKGAIIETILETCDI